MALKIFNIAMTNLDINKKYTRSKNLTEISLVVQWVRVRAPNAGIGVILKEYAQGQE